MPGPFDILTVHGTGTMAQPYTITTQTPHTLLVVGVGMRGGDAGTILYGGGTLTEIGHYVYSASDSVALHAISNPPIGLGTITSGSCTEEYGLFAMVFTDADVGDPYETPGTSAAGTLNIVAPANSVVVDIINSNTNISMDASQTQIGVNQHIIEGAGYVGMSYEYAPAVGGTVSMLWTEGYGDWAHIGVAVNQLPPSSVVWW